MKVDERYKGKTIRQLSSQMAHVSPDVNEQLEAMFNNDQPDEFYAGLLSGFASSEVLLRNGYAHLIPHMIAFVAQKVEKKEIV